MISSLPAGQSFLFKGVSKADLIPGMVEFHFDQVMEDNLEDAFGFSQNDVTLVDRTVLLTPQAPAGMSTDGFQVRMGDLTGTTDLLDDAPADIQIDVSTNDGSTAPPLQDNGADPVVDFQQEVFDIRWAWGVNEVIDFDPQTDVLNFGWMGADAFELTEQQGSIVISIPSNQQTYTLQGVVASDLSLDNIDALDASAMQQWSAFIS